MLHGGEPLLAGTARIGRAAELLREKLPAECVLDLRIHTNGVLLDRRFCDLFLEHDIRVGISLDGDKAANDLHRRYADGRSSHDKVLRAVALLNEPQYRRLFAGLLCTIDVRSDPIAVYDALAELDPPRLDFLLPHATWEHPPLRPDGPESTPYADWLGAVYDRWDAQGRPMPVRTFDSVLRTLRGLSSLTENLGLEPADLVVIETDGTLEQADSLKTAFDGAPATGFDVFRDSFDTVARHPGIVERQSGLDGLSAICRSCPVVQSCGGGLYAHRYRDGSGFDNPSVFCADLSAFIGAVTVKEGAAMPGQAAVEQSEVDVDEDQRRLDERQLGELAAGYGGTDTMVALAEAQLELSRTLLAEAWDRSGDRGRDRIEAKAAWDLLTMLDAEAPGALDAVVAHPYTRAWAVRCLTGADPAAPQAPVADLGGLAEIAAAAALRAGIDEAVEVPVRAGAVRLPGLGRLLVRGGGATDRASVRATVDGFTVEAGGTATRIRWEDGPGATPGSGAVGHVWQPVRRVVVGADWSVALEDTDPQRDSHQWPVTDRLAEAEFGAWSSALGEAWQLIVRALPGYAECIATGLSMVTPLLAPGAGRDISSASRNAFGAVGIARPADSDTLALLLVHEFQHVKLGAVLDLQDLFDPADRRLYYAPWRHDPRPLEGLFQGTYAHVAVTEYWRSRLRELREQGLTAQSGRPELEFARWRAHTADAVETLAASDALTGLGGRFVDGMRATVAPWLDEPVGAAAEAEARRSMAETRASWLAGQGLRG